MTTRDVRRIDRLVFAAIVAITVAAFAVWSVRNAGERPCTHGVSSIGPVSIAADGTIHGRTRPSTEACLP